MKTVKDYNVWDSRDIKDIDVPTSVKFETRRDAENWLEENRYVWGSLQRDSPIGIALEESTISISKWRNMNRNEHRTLDGVLFPIDRDWGKGAIILFFDNKRNTEGSKP